MIWAAISSVARAQMPPNTARAMDSGLMARSALASMAGTEFAANGAKPFGRMLAI